MPWFRLVDSTRTNVCPVEFVLQIDVAKSDRSLHYGTLVGSPYGTSLQRHRDKTITDRDTSLRNVPCSHIGELSPCLVRVTLRPSPPMHPETSLLAQMPTAASISKISAGDMPYCSRLMLFCILFPITISTRSRSVPSPT
jgi:hypothetical protein